MNWQDRIAANSAVLAGKPAIRGTRIAVELVLELFANGWTEQQILENYPQLERADIQAVFAYAHDSLKDVDIIQVDRAA